MIYFVSDMHFGHKNILHLDKRPYVDLHEMEDKLIEMWNTTVKPGDIVYHLGDFFWTKNAARRVAPRLKGEIICIKGNHDNHWWKIGDELPNLNLIQDSIHLLKRQDNPDIVMCHYPMRSWPGSARGSYHLYGHTHRKLPVCGRNLCVCLNVNDFHLVSLDLVDQLLSTRNEPRDEHGPL